MRDDLVARGAADAGGDGGPGEEDLPEAGEVAVDEGELRVALPQPRVPVERGGRAGEKVDEEGG